MLLSLVRFIANLYDFILDVSFCGHSLQKSVDTADQISRQISSQSCRYFILRSVFKDMPLNSNNEFLEVGCGQGRVLSYLIHKKTKWNLTGIDLNKKALDVCYKWKGKKKFTIIEKDVFLHDIGRYSIFFLGHPFDKVNLLKFIDKIEDEITHNIMVIIILDQVLEDYLSIRCGWKLVKQEAIFKYLGISIFSKKNRYSIYSYTFDKNDYC